MEQQQNKTSVLDCTLKWLIVTLYSTQSTNLCNKKNTRNVGDTENALDTQLRQLKLYLNESPASNKEVSWCYRYLKSNLTFIQNDRWEGSFKHFFPFPSDMNLMPSSGRYVFLQCRIVKEPMYICWSPSEPVSPMNIVLFSFTTVHSLKLASRFSMIVSLMFPW